MRTTIVVVALAAVHAVASPQSPSVPGGMTPYLIAISVANIDASSSWYQSVLGLQLLEKKTFEQQGLKVVFLKSEGFRLELVELRNSVSPANCTDTSNPAALRGYGKFAFRVDDLGSVVERLKAHGVALLHDFRSDPVAEERSVIVKDLDGNWLQFFQRPKR